MGSLSDTSVSFARAGQAPLAGLRLEVHKQHLGFGLDVSFEIPPGVTILFGASGAGKTTLLNCIAGLTRPDAGRIEVVGELLYDSSQNYEVPVHRRAIGYVFQDLALFPHLNAGANIGYGLDAVASAERRKRIAEVMASFRISHLRDRKPAEISGGERQRVALARALVINPRLLLLDEPLAGLDVPTKSRIIEDLRSLNQARRIPMLYVTHSREEVFALGEHVLVLENGQLIARGTPHEVMTAPQQETVAQLAGFENILDAEVASMHPDRGTMSCRIHPSGLEMETPLVRAQVGLRLRVGIRAGDILLATVRPEGISARNVLPGQVRTVVQRDLIVVARVDCGLEWEVHLTLAARDALRLTPGRQVWLVVKTHSCHLMAQSSR